MLGPLRVDVALVPAEANAHAGVLVVIDQIRASTTLATLLELGCPRIYVAGAVGAARLLARRRRSLLAGEHLARKPRGFDFDNSPTELTRESGRLAGRDIVLCTTNGTAVLHRVRSAPLVLVGCLRNARACASAATAAALGPPAAHLRATARPALRGTPDIQLVCAGRQGRFVLEDAIAAGVIAGRILEAARRARLEVSLTDPAQAALRLCASAPDLRKAMRDSSGGRTLRKIGQPEDVAFCARVDEADAVPVLRRGPPMFVERLSGVPGGRQVAGTR